MASKVFRALVMGAPGSGKGTVSERIIKRFNLKYLSSGDVLRQNIQGKTPLGLEAANFMQKGQLVPDELVIKCITNQLLALENSSWLLDGFPRTIEQAEYLWTFQKVDSVLNLIVPHKIIINRIQKRWVHLKSGRVYNTEFNAPKVPGIDDVTGEPLIQREDDKPETVQNRLNIYEKTTKPLAEFYKKHGILAEFAGNTTNEIWPSVEAYLENAMK